MAVAFHEVVKSSVNGCFAWDLSAKVSVGKWGNTVTVERESGSCDPITQLVKNVSI